MLYMAGPALDPCREPEPQGKYDRPSSCSTVSKKLRPPSHAQCRHARLPLRPLFKPLGALVRLEGLRQQLRGRWVAHRQLPEARVAHEAYLGGWIDETAGGGREEEMSSGRGRSAAGAEVGGGAGTRPTPHPPRGRPGPAGSPPVRWPCQACLTTRTACVRHSLPLVHRPPAAAAGHPGRRRPLGQS